MTTELYFTMAAQLQSKYTWMLSLSPSADLVTSKWWLYSDEHEKTSDIVIVAGDYNAQLGKLTTMKKN